MEDLLKDFEVEITDINSTNLLSKIWVKPKQTLEYILKKDPDKYVTLFLVLGGMVKAIDRASVKNMGDNMSTLGVLAIAIATGGLFGWISYYIYAWGMSVTGNWLKGYSEPKEFRTVLAWALVPTICSLILIAPQIAVFGDDLFRSTPVNDSTFHSVMMGIFGILEVTLGVWSLVILVKGVALIQKFSIGKSILNIFLPGLVIIVPIILIAFLVNLF